jgi:hypothetical protein
MPHSSDDPPSAPPAERLESDAPSANPPNASGEAAAEAASPPSPSTQEGELRRHRRRRRRRRPPPAPGSQSGAEAHTEQAAPAGEMAVVEDLPTAAPGESEPHKPPRRRRRRRRGLPREAGPQQAATGGDAQAEEGVAVNDPPQSAPEGDPAQSQRPQGLPYDNVPRERHPRRRHRQRRPPHERGPADSESGNEGRSASEGVGDAASRSGPSTNRRPGIGGPRIRRPREAEPRGGERQSADSAERRPRNAGPRDQSGRAPGPRDQGPRARGPRGTPSRDRNRERGREAQQRKPEQKLYALEAVVDRGFEDVTEEADESVTRRMHWTIIKRTVADQRTGKAMSAAYVLQREGVEAEYPNLGAARAAVNKTIVHPEKLTMSKAEHAAAKK